MWSMWLMDFKDTYKYLMNLHVFHSCYGLGLLHKEEYYYPESTQNQYHVRHFTGFSYL